MTISSDISRAGPYNCNGVTIVFGYGFQIADESHLQVTRALADGTQQTLALGSGYSVTGVGNPAGGSISTVTVYPTGDTITILRNVPFTQGLDLENQGAYNAEDVEAALDLLTARDQQIEEKLSRAAVVPPDAGPLDLTNLTADLVAVAAHITEINAVGDNIPSVVTVAGIAADVVACAAVADSIPTAGPSAAAAAASAAAAAASAASAVGFTNRDVWTTATAYAINDLVSDTGSSYIAKIVHTSGASTRPGFGASWQTAWSVVAQAGAMTGPGTTVDGDIPLFNGTSGNILKKVTSLLASKLSYLSTAVGAVLRSGQGKWSEQLSLLDFIPETEHAAIWAGTSSYDCLAAMQAALAYKRPTSSQTASYGAAGYDIYVPPGTYNFSARIEIKRQVRIFGVEGSAMANSSESSVLQFPVGSDGIVIHAYNTIGDGIDSPATTQGSGTVIERLVLKGVRSGTFSASTASKPGKGIWLRGKAAIRDCRILNFDHAGVYCQVAAGSGGILEGNSNNSKLENIRVASCFEGFHIQSADANAMTISGCDASNIDTYGIYDFSFLGNTYIGCHVAEAGNLGKCSDGVNRYYTINAALAGTTTPGTDSTVWVLIGPGGAHAQYPLWVNGNTYYLGYAYTNLGANSCSVYLGCYAEGDNAPSHMLFPAVILGGFFGEVTKASTALQIAANVITGYKQPAKSGSANAWFARYAMDVDTVVNLAAVGDHSSGFSPWKWDNVSGIWYGQHANSGSRIPYYVNTDLSTVTGGRSARIASGNMFFPQGIWLGPTSVARQHTTGTAAPTTGEWAKGDIIWNRDPVAGGKMGWVCTTGGTAGSGAVFKPFGAIDA